MLFSKVTSSDQRFPKRARLLKHADFETIYRKGERQFSANMTVFFVRLAAEDSARVRIGLGVGRALGGAVTRNRIKRRLREAVRRHMQALTPPLDVVINPKRSVKELEFAQLEAEVARAFNAIESGAKRASKGSG